MLTIGRPAGYSERCRNTHPSRPFVESREQNITTDATWWDTQNRVLRQLNRLTGVKIEVCWVSATRGIGVCGLQIGNGCGKLRRGGAGIIGRKKFSCDLGRSRVRRTGVLGQRESSQEGSSCGANADVTDCKNFLQLEEFSLGIGMPFGLTDDRIGDGRNTRLCKDDKIFSRFEVDREWPSSGSSPDKCLKKV